MELFSDILFKLLKNNKITQKQLANNIGCSSGAVNNWIKGIRTPDTNSLIKIANFFNISIETLIEGTLVSMGLEKSDEPELISAISLRLKMNKCQYYKYEIKNYDDNIYIPKKSVIKIDVVEKVKENDLIIIRVKEKGEIIRRLVGFEKNQIIVVNSFVEKYKLNDIECYYKIHSYEIIL